MSFIESVKKIIRSCDRALESAKRGEEPEWTVDGILGGLLTSDRYILPNGERFNLRTWSKTRKKHRLGRHMIDIFGGAYFVEDLRDIDTIVGVRLVNRDAYFLSRYDAAGKTEYHDRLSDLMNSRKRSIIEGNVFDRHTFGAIRTYMAHTGISGFDLAVIQPIGGLDRQMQESGDGSDLLTFYWFQFCRVYELISNQDGLILITLPFGLKNYGGKLWELTKQFVGLLETIPGLRIGSTPMGSLAIEKKKNAPLSISTSHLGQRH